MKGKKHSRRWLCFLIAAALVVTIPQATALTVKAEIYNQDISASTTWNGGNRVGPLTISGGTKENPVVIQVNGTVSVAGQITIAEGAYVSICGGDMGGTLLRGGSYAGDTQTFIIRMEKDSSLKLEHITVDGNYNREIAGTLIAGRSIVGSEQRELILGEGTVLQNNYGGAASLYGGKMIVDGATVMGNHSGGIQILSGDLEFLAGTVCYNGMDTLGKGGTGSAVVCGSIKSCVIRGGNFFDNGIGSAYPTADFYFYGTRPEEGLQLIPSSDIDIDTIGLESDTQTVTRITEAPGNPIESVQVNGAETEERTFTGRITGLHIQVQENPLDTLAPTAVFHKDPYQISATAGTGGGVAVNEEGTFRIAADTGYAIDEIRIDGEVYPGIEGEPVQGATEYYLSLGDISESAKTITAAFAHTLSISNPGNGEISVQRVTGTGNEEQTEPLETGTGTEEQDGLSEAGANVQDEPAEGDDGPAEPVKAGDIVREGDVLIVTVTPDERYRTGEVTVSGMEAVAGKDGYYRVTASVEDPDPPLVAVSKFLSSIEGFQKTVSELEQSDVVYDGSYEKYLNSVLAEYEALSDVEKTDEDVADGLAVLNDYFAAFDVYMYIDWIGTVTHDASCKSRISYAREAYNALSRRARGLVSDEAYRILTDAEAAYHVLDFTQVVTVGNSIFSSGRATVTYGSPAFSLNAVTSGNGKLYYASSNEKVAKVSAGGVVSCVGIGQTVITITAMDTYQYDKAETKVTLTVTKGVQSITVKPGSVASTFHLNATRTGNGALTYASSDSSVASVNSSGVVTVKNAGTVTFTIKVAETALYKSAVKTVTMDITAVKGKTYTVGNLKYKVTSAKTNGSGTVTVTGVKTKKATVTIGKTVKIGNHSYKITAVGAGAFKNNKKLTVVSVGANVKTIGKNAFYGCTKLKKAAIGKGVTSIGVRAFYKCSKLTSIKIQSSVLKKVGTNAVKGSGKKLTVTCPKKKKAAYKKLFSAKTGYQKTMMIK